MAASLDWAGISSQVKLEIGYASLPGALVMETRKSAGMLLTEAAAAVTLSRRSLHEVPGGVFHHSVGDVVLHRVDQFDVADPTLHLADHSGHAFVAFAAQADRPLHRSSLSRPVRPVRTTLER